MAETMESQIVDIVEATLREHSGNFDLICGAGDSMETVAEWDSLAFISVFSAVNEAFGIDPDFDDAVHYLSIASIRDYLASALS